MLIIFIQKLRANFTEVSPLAENVLYQSRESRFNSSSQICHALLLCLHRVYITI